MRRPVGPACTESRGHQATRLHLTGTRPDLVGAQDAVVEANLRHPAVEVRPRLREIGRGETRGARRGLADSGWQSSRPSPSGRPSTYSRTRLARLLDTSSPRHANGHRRLARATRRHPPSRCRKPACRPAQTRPCRPEPTRCLVPSWRKAFPLRLVLIRAVIE